MTAVPTRRERQRQATFDEIVDVSRQLLRDGEDVSVRAVAQEMGLTPPALYRYVDSHAELMVRVARSIFEDVVAAMTEPPGTSRTRTTRRRRSWRPRQRSGSGR